ncbi:uncharacterized protein BCR38DRAFT_491553 [Pseudomassariella vexata]|uniref:Uncharacterized protein n=1 Tax=Pseudomassariella vexata TaxID=1141098 RepID=A0A1Y2EJC3_9PEZI|nr:uncharacterized protein BCR38DRAFT_491553 [Pseudomassariella vexata]ORY70905.1 hypothetical protein BCR38DRAFT_491553 [Pseudomassariella vexata]
MVGTFQINVLDGSNERDDPNTRGYTVAPQVTKTARDYPLQDFREEVFGEGFSYQRSAELLKKHGFTAVKFNPASLINANEDQVRAQHFDSLSVLEETYYPEVVRSMLNLIGAKEVFITNSIIRRGPGATATEGEGDVTVPQAFSKPCMTTSPLTWGLPIRRSHPERRTATTRRWGRGGRFAAGARTFGPRRTPRKPFPPPRRTRARSGTTSESRSRTRSLKFFHSASLGVEGPDAEAPAVLHASPNLGSAGYGVARESIEVRCIAFW